METNKVYNVDCRVGLEQMISEGLQVDCVITSPPYWGMRNYQISPTIWDEDPCCEHDWNMEEKKCIGGHSGGIETSGLFTKEQAEERRDGTGSNTTIEEGFCSKCGAWSGTLGMEPDFNLFVKHLCDIYDLIWKVLKLTGTIWVNLGDKYFGGNMCVGQPEDWNSISTKNRKEKYDDDNFNEFVKKIKKLDYPKKSLIGIPSRFVIEMINRGWILRNEIIWHKKNCMPSSTKDRFTIDYEPVFFFVKSNKNQYWINERTKQLVSKQPIGTKGIERIDWERRDCPICEGTGMLIQTKNTKIPLENSNSFGSPRARNQRYKEGYCKRCEGTGKIKYNFWEGKNYYFDQNIVREKSNTEFIYSRNSAKGNEQEKNNPRKNWGNTKEELKKYNSKYKETEYWQGFDKIKNNRDQSRIEAKELFPNNLKKQQEYINHVHDHGKTNLLGRNKRCVWEIDSTFTSVFSNLSLELQSLILQEMENKKGSMWTISTSPNPEQHFATFPMALVKPMILAGSPREVCNKCGKPRERIVETKFISRDQLPKDHRDYRPHSKNIGEVKGHNLQYNVHPTGCELNQGSGRNVSKTIGWSDCKCNAGYSPGIVLDPFCGTGTTLLQAWKLGRNYIGFEISKEYCKITEKRLKDTKYKRMNDFLN